MPQKPVERVMRNLGVEVIWCRGFENLQTCIKEIHKLGAVRKFGRQPAKYVSADLRSHHDVADS